MMNPYEPDYYCDAVELIKNSKMSDKDKKRNIRTNGENCVVSTI